MTADGTGKGITGLDMSEILQNLARDKKTSLAERAEN